MQYPGLLLISAPRSGLLISARLQRNLLTIATNKSQPADKLKIIKLLLAKGARPPAKNLEGATPIDVAGKFGWPES
jgi:ankyrin repeat protein